MPQDLRTLLKASSRSFYLTLQMVPRPVRTQLCTGYLIARITDTIADTDAVPADARVAALAQVREAIRTRAATGLDLRHLIRPGANPLDRGLLEAAHSAVAYFCSLSEPDRSWMANTLDTIIQGQQFDIEYFELHRARAGTTEPVALPSDTDLDRYLYAVAGCVGELWTRLCHHRLFPRARFDLDSALERGVRFGKALQLINVLRDLARDLRNGRCYLPATRLTSVDLTAPELLEPGALARVRPVLNHYIATARDYLAAAFEYIRALPANQRRLRLACAWAALIGARTLELLESGNPLDPAKVIKVPRGTVRKIILAATFQCLCVPGWPRLGPSNPSGRT